VKTKIYVAYDKSGEKNMTGVKLKSAINFKNFEERKDMKIVHSDDVLVSDGAKTAEKQMVLIDGESLMERSNGLDILNTCEAAITCNADLDKLVKNIYSK
jgi:hypothetical protein